MIKSKKFENWEMRLKDNDVTLTNVKSLACIDRNTGESYLEFYDTLMCTPEGQKFPRCIALRGDSIQVVPLIYCDDLDKLFTIITRQRRITDGGISCEFVGGMIDKGMNPLEVCSNEVKEELGLEIEANEFTQLLGPVSLCTSLLDEKVNFFYFKKTLSKTELDKYHLLDTGIHEDFEYIKTEVIPFDKNIFNLTNVSAGTILATLLVSHKLGIEI